MSTFNLTNEKWLPCVMTDGTLRDLNLREVLLEAAKIKEMIGDSPPVTIALHRLLLAILHRALKSPQSTNEWNEIRQAGEFDREKLESYFDKWKERFDLFDEKHPFYQSISARENVQEGAIIQLYFQGKNNATLFDHSSIGAPNSLSPAEAARCLIAFQGFDFGGIKADGSAQTAPLLQSAIALVKGKNLFETLLYNLHRYDETKPFPCSFVEDLPAWERDEETEAVERLPDGYVDLLTWQARRIFLQPEQNADGETIVKNSVIMRGYAMPKTVGRHAKETMTAFRASKTEGFFPVGFSETRALWRNSMSLLQTVDGEKYRPMILEWLDDLVSAGHLSRAVTLPIDFYGLAADKAKLLFWHQESFDLPLAFLDDENLLESLKTSLEFAEEISGNLRAGAKKLAEKLETDVANFPAMPIYWSTLELKFQSLLLNLPKDKDAAMRDWFTEVLSVADDAFDQTANSLSGSAEELRATVEARGLFYGITYKTKQKPEYKNYVPEIKTKGGTR